MIIYDGNNNSISVIKIVIPVSEKSSPIVNERLEMPEPFLALHSKLHSHTAH